MFEKIKRFITNNNLSKSDTPSFDSANYWENRYKSGDNSGAGSYGRLAQYKADYLNSFVEENDIKSVLELGCGDGNQLSLANYPKYDGVDVSKKAVETCRNKFKDDPSKNFYHYDGKSLPSDVTANEYDLVISLDVIFHLIEDEVYENYLKNLFGTSSRYVIVYSSNTDEEHPAPHVKHRRFSDDVKRLAPDKFKFVEKADNPFPFDAQSPNETSFADFYIFKKIQ